MADGTAVHEHVEAHRQPGAPHQNSDDFVLRLGAFIGDARAGRIADAVAHLEELPSMRALCEPLREVRA